MPISPPNAATAAYAFSSTPALCWMNCRLRVWRFGRMIMTVGIGAGREQNSNRYKVFGRLVRRDAVYSSQEDHTGAGAIFVRLPGFPNVYSKEATFELFSSPSKNQQTFDRSNTPLKPLECKCKGQKQDRRNILLVLPFCLIF